MKCFGRIAIALSIALLAIFMVSCSSDKDITGYYELFEIRLGDEISYNKEEINDYLEPYYETRLYLDIKDDNEAVINTLGSEIELIRNKKDKTFISHYNDGIPEYIYNYEITDSGIILTGGREDEEYQYTFVFNKTARPGVLILPSYYGVYMPSKIESTVEDYYQDIYGMILDDLLDKGQIFYFKIGNDSILYIPDGKGGYVEFPVIFDMYLKKIRFNSTVLKEFDYIDGVFMFEDGDYILTYSKYVW